MNSHELRKLSYIAVLQAIECPTEVLVSGFEDKRCFLILSPHQPPSKWQGLKWKKSMEACSPCFHRSCSISYELLF